MRSTAVTATGDYRGDDDVRGRRWRFSSSCTANVVFKPTAAGARAGTLTVATNVPGGNTFDVLTGTGLMPDFSVADASGKAATAADGGGGCECGGAAYVCVADDLCGNGDGDVRGSGDASSGGGDCARLRRRLR